MKLVLPGRANSCCGNCVCSNTITNTFTHTDTHAQIFLKVRKITGVIRLQRFPRSCFYFRSLHNRKTSPVSVSIDDYTQSPVSPASRANSFSDTQTHMRVSGSLRIVGCFFPPAAALRGNTQSVINHGGCLWEGSAAFLLHRTDKLHYQQLKKPALMRNQHTHLDGDTHTHTLGYDQNLVSWYEKVYLTEMISFTI